MFLKSKKGVSLITVVITIVVVIILTTIVMSTSSEIPDDANYAKYIQEMKNVQSAVDDAKVKNAYEGTTEEKLNAGFKKVFLEEIPASFIAYVDDYGRNYGYMVNLENIDYMGAEYGQGYEKYEEMELDDRVLVFGDKECDVFVYDSEWTVHYVKGLQYDGSMNYTAK